MDEVREYFRKRIQAATEQEEARKAKETQMQKCAEVDEMTENRTLRELMISRVETLDKVKKLFLIPSFGMLTARQIADYYEVDIEIVKKCYQRHKSEIDSDGTTVKNLDDFAKISIGTQCPLRKQSAVHVFEYEVLNKENKKEKVEVVISNRGIRCFSKRAVLRFGMLLVDSKVAQKVRTQLLNVFEHAAEEKPEILTQDIQEETNLMLAVGKAFANGDVTAMLKATTEYNEYKNRYIKAIESEKAKLVQDNEILTTKNEKLAQDNNILAGEIAEWSDSQKANKIVRSMARELSKPFGVMWGIIYDELNYKYHISLKQRQIMDKTHTKLLVSYIKENEWEYFYKITASILQNNGINPSLIFNKAKVKV